MTITYWTRIQNISYKMDSCPIPPDIEGNSGETSRIDKGRGRLAKSFIHLPDILHSSFSTNDKYGFTFEPGFSCIVIRILFCCNSSCFPYPSVDLLALDKVA
jgi:hypothetical protein